MSVRVNSPGWDLHGPVPDSELAATAAAWDAEYAAGRYAGDPPVEFVRDIIAAAAQRGLRQGLYVGCGSGRNLLPLLDAALTSPGWTFPGRPSRCCGPGARTGQPADHRRSGRAARGGPV